MVQYTVLRVELKIDGNFLTIFTHSNNFHIKVSIKRFMHPRYHLLKGIIHFSNYAISLDG